MQALLGLQQQLQRGCNAGCSTSSQCGPSPLAGPCPKRGSRVPAAAVTSRSRSHQRTKRQQPAVEVAEFIDYHDDMFFGTAKRSGGGNAANSNGAGASSDASNGNGTTASSSSGSNSSTSTSINHNNSTAPNNSARRSSDGRSATQRNVGPAGISTRSADVNNTRPATNSSSSSVTQDEPAVDAAVNNTRPATNSSNSSSSSSSSSVIEDEPAVDAAGNGQRILLMHHLIDKQYQRKLRAFSRSMTPEVVQQLYATLPADMLPQLELILADAQAIKASMPAASASFEEEEGEEEEEEGVAAAAAAAAAVAEVRTTSDADEQDDELSAMEAALYRELLPSKLPGDFYSYLAELMPDTMSGEEVEDLIGSLDLGMVAEMQQLYNEMKEFEAAQDVDMDWATDKFVELSSRMEQLTDQLGNGSSGSSSSVSNTIWGEGTSDQTNDQQPSSNNDSSSSESAETGLGAASSSNGVGGTPGSEGRVWGKSLVRKRGRPPKQAPH